MNLGNQISGFLLAITFFSRISLPDRLGRHIGHDSSLIQAAAMFPVAGMVIGLIPALVWLVSLQWLPALLSACLAVLAGVVLTGALHEDGLADCADGLWGSADRTRALEIMRDSRAGSYGALALVASFVLRVTALSALSAATGFWALIVAHAVSRSAITLAMRFSRYARPQGLGKLADGRLPDATFYAGLTIATAAAFLFGGLPGIAATVCGLLTAWFLLSYLERRLGGYTGDGLGAMQQIAEITVMIVFAGFWT